jgi:hypothetical protein
MDYYIEKGLFTEVYGVGTIEDIFNQLVAKIEPDKR